MGRSCRKAPLTPFNNPSYVSIHLHPFPFGFELSQHNDCVCSSLLTSFVISCSIDTMVITRKSNVWLSAANNTKAHDEGKNMSVVYMIHQHCPFDYCLPGEFHFSLEDPDAQCNRNRSGILCGAPGGKCKPGYSLTLGTNECKQCTNIYLLLLAPFGLAGIRTADCFPFPHRHDSYCWHHQWVALLCKHCARKSGYIFSNTSS